MQASDIMIHIHEKLNVKQQSEIESQLRKEKGVIAPRFNKEKLLLIYYNVKNTNSLTLLNFIKSRGYRANLVGL